MDEGKRLPHLIQPQCNGKGWDGEIQGASPVHWIEKLIKTFNL